MRMITSTTSFSKHGPDKIGLRLRVVEAVAVKVGRALARIIEGDWTCELLSDDSLDR
jgi:hypothetical protein